MHFIQILPKENQASHTFAYDHHQLGLSIFDIQVFLPVHRDSALDATAAFSPDCYSTQRECRCWMIDGKEIQPLLIPQLIMILDVKIINCVEIAKR